MVAVVDSTAVLLPGEVVSIVVAVVVLVVLVVVVVFACFVALSIVVTPLLSVVDTLDAIVVPSLDSDFSVCADTSVPFNSVLPVLSLSVVLLSELEVGAEVVTVAVVVVSFPPFSTGDSVDTDVVLLLMVVDTVVAL